MSNSSEDNSTTEEVNNEAMDIEEEEDVILA